MIVPTLSSEDPQAHSAERGVPAAHAAKTVLTLSLAMQNAPTAASSAAPVAHVQVAPVTAVPLGVHAVAGSANAPAVAASPP